MNGRISIPNVRSRSIVVDFDAFEDEMSPCDANHGLIGPATAQHQNSTRQRRRPSGGETTHRVCLERRSRRSSFGWSFPGFSVPLGCCFRQDRSSKGIVGQDHALKANGDIGYHVHRDCFMCPMNSRTQPYAQRACLYACGRGTLECLGNAGIVHGHARIIHVVLFPTGGFFLTGFPLM